VVKLHAVAAYMGIPTAGRAKEQIALDVGNKALEQFGQQRGEIICTVRATPKRQQLWRELGIMPRGVDIEVWRRSTGPTKGLIWIPRTS